MNLITAGLRPLAVPPTLKTPGVAMYLGISLITPLYFGIISLIYATISGPIIQDDARLHIVWLQRLIDPQLFPHDPIADYYLAIQSGGFKIIYAIAATIGIEPLVLAKMLPLGLALTTTIYVFWTTLLILPVPFSGIVTTLILNQNIWLKDDLISATPRAFVYPLLAAFLYYLLREKPFFYLGTLMLQGLFYPQVMLVSFGLISLRMIQKRRQAWFRIQLLECDRIWLMAFCLTGFILLFFSHHVAEQVGPLLTAADMKTMPEFQLDGRREYYGVSLLHFMFAGASGLRFPLFPPIITIGIFFPFLLRVKRFPLSNHITSHLLILTEIILVSLGLFLLAHLSFPALYLPSRYTFYSMRFVLAIASGLVLTLMLERAWNWLEQRPLSWSWGDRIKVIFGWGMAIAIIIAPAIPQLFLPCQSWIVDQSPQIYEQLAQFPKDTLIASLTSEASNIPAFSQRSVLVAEEFALPYHVDFYTEMIQRMQALVQAQYSQNLVEIKNFIQEYGIDLWIIDRRFTEPDYLAQQKWLINSLIQDGIADIIKHINQGKKPILTTQITSCSIFSEHNLIVLDAHCLANF